MIKTELKMKRMELGESESEKWQKQKYGVKLAIISGRI